MLDHEIAAIRHRRYAALRWVVAALSLLLAAGTFVANRALAQAAAEAADEEFYRAAEVFMEIFNEVQEKYVEEISTEDLMESAIRGIFAFSLDPHSQYMGPDTYDQLTQSTQGEFFGIGIHITIRDGVLTVIAPIPNTPSARLGIQPWDRIIEINGESTEGMSLPEAVRLLKGPRGSTVDVGIFRASPEPGGEGEFLDFTITRDEINIESIFSDVLDDHIGYLRIAQFSEDTGQDARAAAQALLDEGIEALILDLRFNTGGLLSQAIEVADIFLPENALIVSTDGRLATQNRRYRSEHGVMVDVPMLVLVNAGSASASEIVAGALQDHHRALIVGPEGGHTFGKASVQTIEELENTLSHNEDGSPRASAIRLTTAHYLTPDGRMIHDVGIEPDIGIPLPTGHENELMRRGMLLGEPNTVEDTEHLEAVRVGLENGNHQGDEGEGETMEQPETEGEPETQPALDDTEAEGGDGEFHDIMLDEAVRYLRVHLMMQREVA
ncbi:S41 family peptidase [Candidatus Sumerlaeota bacterium]|nr:S41 family peptidase [Candidatus Sumerlaeota bacterium]